MSARDAWITGIGLVTSLGEGAEAHWAALSAGTAPRVDEAAFAPFPVHPAPALELDRQIPKKGDQRQMEPWQRAGTYAAGLALDSAGARGLVSDMHMIVAAGGGERDIALDEAVAAEIARLPPEQAGPVLNERLQTGLRPTLFLAQLSNLLAGNISIVHGVTGSSRTFMGEESAAADAVRIACARLAEGRGEVFLVGGAFLGARWDMLLLYGAGGGLLRGPFAPVSARTGMVLGCVNAFLVIEAAEHARARGAAPLARIAAVATDASRRAAPGAIRASLEGLWQGMAAAAPAGPLAVISGASGAVPATAEERGFLSALAPAALRTPASLWGHGMEAAFPANIALGALALSKRALFAPCDPADSGSGAPAAVLVTGVGHWRGEALALLLPAEEER
ncbi:MAG: beta-ketoacyl-ACP synthase [Acetobacteraceae bacterium]|nr:beta-ketoacyl-ACP synthase [Acetobacteraceae bacterium]